MSQRDPFVDELPPVVDTTAWEWTAFSRPMGDTSGFFLGRDPDGCAWLTKMRGPFKGYREIVFERLAQRCGWLCQSSSFAVLEEASLPRKSTPWSSDLQVVTRFLSEHREVDCSSICPIGPLRGDLMTLGSDPLELLADSPLEDALNIARADILGPLLGGIEPAGYLTTEDHRVFLIDGELMFATEPSEVWQTSWWDLPDGSPWLRGRRLTLEMCSSVGALSDAELDILLGIPDELKFDMPWPIRPIVYAVRDYGRAFADLFG